MSKGAKLVYPLILADLHVRSGCVCMDEKIAIPNVLREALVEDLHGSHPGTWGMICIANHCWWPNMNRELIVRSTERKSCTAVGINLKSVIPARQFHAHIPCAEPNHEVQIDLVAPVNDEKGHESYFFVAIDRFSKFPTVFILDKADGPNLIKFQKRLLKIMEYSVPSLWIKQTDLCVVHKEHTLKIIFHQLRICKQKTTKNSPFEAHFGQKPNTPLSVFFTLSNLSNLYFEIIINYYLKEEKIIPKLSFLTTGRRMATEVIKKTRRG